MKITRVSLQSKLDELMSLLHTYLLMKITCVAIESVHPGSIAVKHALFHRRKRVDNDIVHSASIAVKHALFSSKNTCQH